MRFRDQDKEAETVWGAKRIAVVINQTESATFHLLKKDRIAGARRIGTRWCLYLPEWRASFRNEVAA
jgi:hypothetical protein